MKWLILFFLFPLPLRSAELALYIGDDVSGSFEDGDILHAMNDTRILDVHAQTILHPKLIARNNDTLISTNSLRAFYLERIRQYRFERTGLKTVRRINLLTGTTDFFSDVPNADGEAIDVPRYIDGKVRSPHHQVFGEKGSEVWYGGRTSCTLVEINEVWAEIEVRTAFRKVDHLGWAYGAGEKKKYLIFKVNDFDMIERGELQSALFDNSPDPSMLKARKHNIDWRNDLGLTTEQKDNIDAKIGSRDFRAILPQKNRDVIVKVKEKAKVK